MAVRAKPSKRAAPWRGRPRVKDPKQRFVAVRCTDQQYANLNAAASKAGLSIGAFLRATALGSPGPRAVRRPPVELGQLACLLGQIGKVGGNINQLSAHCNRTLNNPGLLELRLIRRDLAVMRIATLNAMGRRP